MRVKLEVVTLDENVIFVSQEAAEQLDNSVSVCFGSLSVDAQVKVKYPIYKQGKNGETDSSIEVLPDSFINTSENKLDGIGEALEMITISSRLYNELYIQENLTYQVRLLFSQIVIGPVIGLLLRDSKINNKNKILKGNSSRFSYYKNIGGLVCKFKSKDIDFNSKLVEGHYYNFDNSRWEPGIFPLPILIYRRSFHINSNIISKLKVMTNHLMFNSYRFNKFELYQYLREDPVLCNYLPYTEVCSDISQIYDFIKKHKNVILKPIDLSRGRGICIIQTIHSRFKISDLRKKDTDSHSLVDYKSLILFLKRNKTFLNKYIMQKLIPLAQINGYPYDIRVVMQKTARDKWEYIGIECRVSRSSLITNISRGGYALTLEDAIAKSFEGEDCNEIKNKICTLCDKLCTYIDKRTGEHYAEFGIDIALDAEKKLSIIEVNVNPSFNGFKDIDYNLYNHILSNPLLYAVSLTEFKDVVDKEVLQK
jgi:glutathione synthase/RimK-type ligase-like ATP-grasp enzyme